MRDRRLHDWVFGTEDRPTDLRPGTVGRYGRADATPYAAWGGGGGAGDGGCGGGDGGGGGC